MLPDDTGAPGPTDFDDLFREHYWPMVRSLSVAYGDREAAADAVQEAFTRAYTRWRRISAYDNPAAWVRHVALNRLRDHFRHQQRGTRALTRLAGRAREVTAGPEPVEDVAPLLAALPRQQRIAAALYYVEELSVARGRRGDAPLRRRGQISPSRGPGRDAGTAGRGMS